MAPLFVLFCIPIGGAKVAKTRANTDVCVSRSPKEDRFGSLSGLIPGAFSVHFGVFWGSGVLVTLLGSSWRPFGSYCAPKAPCLAP